MQKIITTLLVVAMILGGLALMVKALDTPDPVSYETYVVKQGDTLWSIAQQSDMWNKMDARNIIDDMEERSNCNALIYPGQIVYIPMYNN